MPSTATLFVTTSILATLIVAGYFYFTGQADDVIQWIAEKYFKAEAKAEEKALEKAGETKAEGFLKERLKKNPVVSNEQLNEISGGLGDEAAKEFGDGIGKAFG